MNSPAPGTAQMPLFYKNIVALSREHHKGWYIDGDQGFGFTAGSSSVYLAASEFALASREYPIVFARDDAGLIVPVAMLGLRPEENLMIDERSRWQANYVPAYIRRYPFILATPSPESDEFTVCIDESYSGFNTAAEGVQLIDDEGQHSERLQQSVNFLQEFQKHTELTKRFCRAVDEAGMFETMQAEIKLNSGEKFTVSGFLSVTREKLKALSAEQLKSFHDNGYLELIYLHINSLANLDALMRRVPKKETPVAN